MSTPTAPTGPGATPEGPRDGVPEPKSPPTQACADRVSVPTRSARDRLVRTAHATLRRIADGTTAPTGPADLSRHVLSALVPLAAAGVGRHAAWATLISGSPAGSPIAARLEAERTARPVTERPLPPPYGVRTARRHDPGATPASPITTQSGPGSGSAQTGEDHPYGPDDSRWFSRLWAAAKRLTDPSRTVSRLVATWGQLALSPWPGRSGPARRAVALAVVEEAISHQTQAVRIGRAELAARTGISDRSVRLALRALTDGPAPVLHLVDRSRGGLRPHRYRVATPGGQARGDSHLPANSSLYLTPSGTEHVLGSFPVRAAGGAPKSEGLAGPAPATGTGSPRPAGARVAWLIGDPVWRPGALGPTAHMVWCALLAGPATMSRLRAMTGQGGSVAPAIGRLVRAGVVEAAPHRAGYRLALGGVPAGSPAAPAGGEGQPSAPVGTVGAASRDGSSETLGPAEPFVSLRARLDAVADETGATERAARAAAGRRAAVEERGRAVASWCRTTADVRAVDRSEGTIVRGFTAARPWLIRGGANENEEGAGRPSDEQLRSEAVELVGVVASAVVEAMGSVRRWERVARVVDEDLVAVTRAVVGRLAWQAEAGATRAWVENRALAAVRVDWAVVAALREVRAQGAAARPWEAAGADTGETQATLRAAVEGLVGIVSDAVSASVRDVGGAAQLGPEHLPGVVERVVSGLRWPEGYAATADWVAGRALVTAERRLGLDEAA